MALWMRWNAGRSDRTLTIISPSVLISWRQHVSSRPSAGPGPAGVHRFPGRTSRPRRPRRRQIARRLRHLVHQRRIFVDHLHQVELSGDADQRLRVAATRPSSRSPTTTVDLGAARLRSELLDHRLDSSMPSTRTPVAANGTASRPVPTASSSTDPSRRVRRAWPRPPPRHHGERRGTGFHLRAEAGTRSRTSRRTTRQHSHPRTMNGATRSHAGTRQRRSGMSDQRRRSSSSEVAPQAPAQPRSPARRPDDVVIDADKGMTRPLVGTTSGSPRASPDQNWSTTAAAQAERAGCVRSRARQNGWRGHRRVHRPHRCW